MQPAPPKKPPPHHWLASRFPFYYGWMMVPLAMVTALATSPGQTYGVSVFNPSLREALSISHSQLTGAYMFGTLLAALPQPFFGRLMDRMGIRRLSGIVVVALGLACLFTARVTGLVGLFFAFWSLRTFGQGALNLVANNTLAMWFQKRLGLVSGLFNVGMALTMGLVPAGMLWLIQRQGWRGAYTTVGVLVWLVMLPLVVWFFRDRPEDIGQPLDGVPAPPRRAGPAAVQTQTALPLKIARQTRGYWIMLLITTAWGLIITGITFNILPLFAAQGYDETLVAATFTALAAATAVVQLASGVLADRLPLRWLAAASMAALALSAWVLMQLTAPWVAFLYAVLAGAGQGVFSVVNATVWAQYFGRDFLGEIRGSVWLAMVAGSSVGPFAMGAAYDQFGSYRFILGVFCGLLTLLAVAAWWATPPDRKMYPGERGVRLPG